MKAIYSLVFFLSLSQWVFSNSNICPDPPGNDDPCINSTNPPLNLSGGSTETGTTCCATIDFDNVSCSNANNASVWYMFTPDGGDEGINIHISPLGNAVEGPMTVEVYVGLPDQGCNAGFSESLAASCTNTEVNIKLGNCFAPNEVIFIKVSTSANDENCGEFTISVLTEIDVVSPDDCIDLSEYDPLSPITNEDFSFNYQCVTGSLDFACPEKLNMGGCEAFGTMPTVWFQIVVDTLAGQLFTTVEPNGSWDAIWSIYTGPDCDNLLLVESPGSGACSNGGNTPNLYQVPIIPNENSYWVMVTVDPNNLPSEGLVDGSFEICASTTINTNICIGDLEGAGSDESLVLEIIERENTQLPLDGPFCQGEEVTINFSFLYDSIDLGGEYFIGLVPKFGNGWDLSNFDYNTSSPMANGENGLWYEEGGALAPIIQENISILCTYRDEEGTLQICNQLCEPCSECENQGMVEGDPLPSGYFWVRNGSNVGCDNDGSPGEGWGVRFINGVVQIDWMFTLKAKTFDNSEDCMSHKDLSIRFQIFSDEVAGCWENPIGECFFNRALLSPSWEIECEVPSAVEGADQEICHDGITDIFVQTVDGSTNTIVVEVDDNPNVTGEMNHTFSGGTGYIVDDLRNLTNDIQTVTYNVYSQDETLPCPGVVNQIDVTIYPELKVSFPPVYVCNGTCTDITPDIVGGIGAPYTYNWSTGATSSSINICPLLPTTYFVTIEDGLGCTDNVGLEVDVKPFVHIELPESIDVIKDIDFDPFNPDYIVCLDFLEGTPPFGVTWNPPLGLVGNASGVFGECFVINEAASLESGGDNGQYLLSVSVVDFFGCQGVDTMTVNILVDDPEPIDFKLIYDFFIDDNANGIRDSLENSFGEGAFYLEPIQSIYYNTSPGEDTLIVQEGEYTLTYIPATIDEWILTTDGIFTVNLDSIENCMKVEFGLKRNDLLRDVDLTHFLIRRCNTFQDFYVIAENNGTKTESGVLWAELDEAIVPGDIMTSTIIDTFIAPNTVGWFFNDLLPGNKIVKTVNVYVPGPPDLPVGWVLNHTMYAGVSNDDGTAEIWGETSLSGNIQCGYDPNDKAVEPNSEEGYTNIEQEDLVFKIRFQNTGNAPTENILISDTLSEFLDVSSVQYIAGSHDEFLNFSRVGDNVLRFTFNNINLPDSTSDLAGSQGFLIYRVSLNDELSEGTLIENTAEIYFDNNPAVVTNTTKNILYPDLDGDGFFSIEDCDDDNAEINPDAVEIVNNEVDEDCDGVAQIIDVDMDGFNSDEDCDDDNADINPDAVEIANNEIDEDCDGLALIIDVDMDGFNSDEDCDDDNADINPDAEEIPDNGIDEDCDGLDSMIVNIIEVDKLDVQIWPNPSNDAFNITINSPEKVIYAVRDVMGREVVKGVFSSQQETIYLGLQPNGIYLILLSDLKQERNVFYKLLKI